MTREEAIQIIKERFYPSHVGLITNETRENAKALRMAIEALSAEAVHGEWTEHKWAEECDGLLISNYECTNCHSWERNNTDFCPSCGADMRKENK